MLIQERYRLVKLIGQGGFGKTFLGVDEAKSPPVACLIKQFSPQNQAPDAFNKAKALFQQEALRLEELGKHPQIPSLLAHFEHEGSLYLVQEFMDGANLAKVVEEEGAFSEAQIWQLLEDLLPVLKFIHDRQVIHRDIKPENIIRRNFDRRLVLVDFGAAKSVTGINLLKTGTSIGSPEYVAPEQARGKAVFASDLYSLGVTCIYLLTGIPPFDLFDVANDCWAWKHYLTSDVSDRVSHILDKLIQNAVKWRFQSADEVMEKLESRQFGRLKAESSNLQPANVACSATLTGNSGLFKSVNSVAFSPDDQLLASGGDDKIIRLWNPNTWQLIRTLSGHGHAVTSVAFNSQGNLLASASDDRTIRLWNYDTGQEIRTLAGHDHAVKSVAFCPQVNLLASGSWDKTVKLWDVNTGVELFTLSSHKLQVSAIAFSPDGQFMASASFDRTVRLYSLPSPDTSGLCPQPCGTLAGHNGHVFSVAFSSNGKTIATAADDNTIKLWDIHTGQLLHTLLGHSWSVVAVAFSPDGETLISGSWDKTVKLWKMSTGQQICTLCGHLDSVCAVSLSSTGQIIASGSKDKTVKLWQAFC